MMKPTELPDVVPVFPLPGALLLPRSHLPLHLFEPRYLALFEDCLKSGHRLIGMVQPYEAAGRNPSGLYQIGCAGRLTQFSETQDGRYMITLTGISRFRLGEEHTGFTPYRRFEVDWEGFGADLGGSEQDPAFDRSAFMGLLSRYFDDQGLSTDWDSLKEADDELLINSLSMLLSFGSDDKQALLEAPSLETRRETLVALMEYALRGGDGKEMLQ